MDRKRIKTELLIHDLKNPLAIIETGISSLVQGEEKYGPLTKKQVKILQRTLRNIKITKNLVNDVLELGRSSEGIINETEFPIFDLIRYVLIEVFDIIDYNTSEIVKESQDLSQLKRILSRKGILLEVSDGLWQERVGLDGRKVIQILRNLLNNAVRYKKEHIEIRIEKTNGFLFMSVKDDGEGIAKAYQKKIFDCYFQLDEEEGQCIRGHGLGLAGALILVEDMGGKMHLESDTGKGATFSVMIPINNRQKFNGK
jgi:two-component system OmpR family sensor kinase